MICQDYHQGVCCLSHHWVWLIFLPFEYKLICEFFQPRECASSISPCHPWVEERLIRPHPNLQSYWQLKAASFLGKEESVSSEAMGALQLPTLYWSFFYLCPYRQHLLDSVWFCFYVREKKKWRPEVERENVGCWRRSRRWTWSKYILQMYDITKG